jgi:hypothetical protein
MMVENEPFPSVFIISAYLPNKSSRNTMEYIKAVAAYIIKLVDKAVKGGCPAIIGIDANCPFKEPRVFPPAKNSPILRIILEEAGIQGGGKLRVINWEPRTKGF